VIGFVLGGLLVLLLSLRGIAAFYTDYLWFSSLGLAPVWRSVLNTKIFLTLFGGLFFFTLCWLNLVIAERIAPTFRPLTTDDDLVERYHELVGGRASTVRLVTTTFLSVLFGVSLGSTWNEWILFANRVDFGRKDATFHTDVGFYVFQLPFLTSVASWLFSALVLVLLVTLVNHVLNGGIRLRTPLERVTPQVKAHVSVLLAVLAVLQAGRYWLGRYDLTFSTRGTVDGATYTDVNVELRALYLLIVIALFAAGFFIANIWRRGWVLPGIAVGLWIFTASLAGGVVPAFVQRFRVVPSESSMESRYIAQNIAATRDAYGLDVESEAFDWKGDLDAEALADNVDTLRSIRLWDPAIMQTSFVRQQQIKSFFAINDVDIDRYMIDGRLTPVLIAARDLATSGVQQSSWEATHLAFTHGYGVVAATANDRTSSGDPDLVASGIPVSTSGGMPSVDQPGLYFGERKSGYVIVDTDRAELDFGTADEESGSSDQPSTTTPTASAAYDGADGIVLHGGVTGFVRRAAFALRFGDINPLVSGNIRPDSRILIERDVTARLQAVAPFLAYDHDPYAVVIDGKVKYVVDAYTTSNHYPNAQRADTGGLDSASGLRDRSFNYARNSVKAVVDAYDGTVDLYVIDREDPIIRAYRKAFPSLFTDGAQAPDELQQHYRYPEDLFTVQTQMWARYHVSDTDTFYNGNDEWSVPAEPGGRTVSGEDTTRVGADGEPIKASDRYQSKYLLLRLPGDERQSFVILRPFVAASKGSNSGQNQLTGFMVAGGDPEDYGVLRSFELPSRDLPEGPTEAIDNMQSDKAVAELRRQLCQGKSECDFATPAIIPIANSILYVQSFFVRGTEVGAPKLQQVIVSYQSSNGTEIAVDGTLRGALVKIFGDAVPEGVEDTEVVVEPGDGSPDDPGETPTTTVPSGDPGTVAARRARLVADLVDAFDAADAAARRGDLVAREEALREAERISRDLADLDGSRPPSSSTTSTTSSSTTTTTRPSGSSSTTTTAPP
jgi:uncharacterized membrane protein (UPF0182 family)